MRLTKLTIYALVALLALTLVQAAQAANRVGISVAPLRYTYAVDPGQTIEDTIIVSNPNEDVLTVIPEFQDFVVREGNNIQWVPADVENPYKLSDWITIAQEPVTLQPNGQARLPFTIKVPSNATAGGKYAALFFRAEGGGGGTIGSVPRVGSLIVLTVNGDLKRTGGIVGFTTSSFFMRGPVNFGVSYLNSGTTHYETQAEVSIKNLFWNSANLKSDGKIVYPNIKRDLPVSWNVKFPFGIYTATAKAKAGDGTYSEASKTFVAIPLNYVGPAILILLLLWLAIRAFMHTFKIERVGAIHHRITRKVRHAVSHVHSATTRRRNRKS